MLPPDYESLVFFRRFPNNFDYASITNLFCDNSANAGYFPAPGSEHISWAVRQEFASINYGEPLECVHARRTAFGCDEIYIDLDRVTPDRCLIFPAPKIAMNALGNVRIRWCVPDAMEIPKFCVSSATSDQCRVKWGLGPHRIEMLKAATTLRPNTFDVFGFFVPGKGVAGAAEIVRRLDGELFESHLFFVSPAVVLAVGDELWGSFTGNVGATRVTATRLLAIIDELTEQRVPPLERPDGR